MVNTEIKKDIKVYHGVEWKLIHNTPTLTGHNGRGAKRKVHSTKCIDKEIRGISYKQLNTTLESPITKRGKHTQEELMVGNKQQRDEINTVDTTEQYKELMRPSVIQW